MGFDAAKWLLPDSSAPSHWIHATYCWHQPCHSKRDKSMVCWHLKWSPNDCEPVVNHIRMGCNQLSIVSLLSTTIFLCSLMTIMHIFLHTFPVSLALNPSWIDRPKSHIVRRLTLWPCQTLDKESFPHIGIYQSWSNIICRNGESKVNLVHYGQYHQ